MNRRGCGLPVRGALLGGLLLCAGCGVVFGEAGIFRNRSGDYLKATSVQPLELPPGLDGEAIEDIYYVPPIDANAQPAQQFEVSRPQPLVAGDFDDRIKIQSLGQEQWILVRLLPGQVWPHVRDFLIQRRVGVGGEDGAQGVILSPWISSSQSAFDEIYRFSLMQGVQRNTTEIRVRQAQRSAGVQTSSRAEQLARGGDWPPSSDDARRERLMLQQFASYLSGSADINAPVSLMAQGISTATRLYTVPGKAPLIRVNLEADRAWASLGLALDKAGFEVLKRNRVKSVYQVNPPVVEEEKKQNWFLALFKRSTYRKDKTEQEYRMLLEAAPEPDWMQIRVSPASTGDDAAPLPAEEQRELLMRVKAFLS